MSKREMHTFVRPYSTLSCSRSIIIIFLFVLCIPIFLYQLVPTFTQSTDILIDSVVDHFRASHCTAEIGNAQCCALFMDATPCVDECQKQFVDRETFTLTAEYDECANTCLRNWESCTRTQEREHTT